MDWKVAAVAVTLLGAGLLGLAWVTMDLAQRVSVLEEQIRYTQGMLGIRR